MNSKKLITTIFSFLFLTILSAQQFEIKGKAKEANNKKDTLKSYSIDTKITNGLFKNDRVIFGIKHLGNKLTANYYEIKSPKIHRKDSIYIPYKSFVAISQWKRGLDASILTIPFKIRPKLDTIPSSATADIKNIGLFLGNSFQSERYFYNGKTSKHSFTLGGFISPTLIELNKTNTNNQLDSNLVQLGLSVGGGINYTYKSVSFVLIPFGFDFGLTKQSKDWIHNGKYWFGFGLGIDTTLLSF